MRVKMRHERTGDRAWQQNSQALQMGRFYAEHMGRRIEEHFRPPQDIEWCLVDDTFYIVQIGQSLLYTRFLKANIRKSRLRSVGHQQMMTDAMKPLDVFFPVNDSVIHAYSGEGCLLMLHYAGFTC